MGTTKIVIVLRFFPLAKFETEFGLVPAILAIEGWLTSTPGGALSSSMLGLLNYGRFGGFLRLRILGAQLILSAGVWQRIYNEHPRMIFYGP